ncbi:MAG TPA: class I SAM-dependent methyltransferase [Ktedonobacterales bacterium]|nr:class I SAM-dependent methyltransferase [Ktedonobacterales bacterium]
MESLRGKHALGINAHELAARLAGYTDILIDLGTGDGRFVQSVAQTQPATFAIGIDACRENLRARTLCTPPNALYLIANVLALPTELEGLATRLTVNFPWGSLLEALLEGEPACVARLAALTRPGARIEVRLNAGALAEAGWPLEEGARQVRRTLRAARFDIQPPVALGPRELSAYPTTWAHRLAFGRDPRALELRGERL